MICNQFAVHLPNDVLNVHCLGSFDKFVAHRSNFAAFPVYLFRPTVLDFVARILTKEPAASIFRLVHKWLFVVSLGETAEDERRSLMYRGGKGIYG